jgi:hypothetical protein
MKLKCAYIFCVPGCDPKRHNAIIDAPMVKMWVIGVNDQEEGVNVCKKLVNEDGVQLIELCGDWGYSGAAKVQEAIGENAVVGAIFHQVKNTPKLAGILRNLL